MTCVLGRLGLENNILFRGGKNIYACLTLKCQMNSNEIVSLQIQVRIDAFPRLPTSWLTVLHLWSLPSGRWKPQHGSRSTWQRTTRSSWGRAWRRSTEGRRQTNSTLSKTSLGCGTSGRKVGHSPPVFQSSALDVVDLGLTLLPVSWWGNRVPTCSSPQVVDEWA